jgi:hypothetical protein
VRLPPLNPKASPPLKHLAAALGALLAAPAGDAGQLLQWTPRASGTTLPPGGRAWAREDHDSAACCQLCPGAAAAAAPMGPTGGGLDYCYSAPTHDAAAGAGGGGSGSSSSSSRAGRLTALLAAPGPARLWCGTAGGVVHCWALAPDGAPARWLHAWTAHTGKIKAIALSPTGRLFTGVCARAVTATHCCCPYSGTTGERRVAVAVS